MANVVDYLINTAGISQHFMILLLGLPFIAVIIGVSRYYIGVKTFNLYSPILLCVAFFLIQEKYPGDHLTRTMGGVLYGSLLTVLMIVFTVVADQLYKKITMHFFPKVSLIFSTVVIFTILMLVVFQYSMIINLKFISFASLILILVVFEKFINIYTKKKFKTAIQLSVETLLLTLVCYIFISIYPVQTFLLANPWVIILTVPFNLIIGKFTGLRLNEYIRFQDILDKSESETEENESK